MYIMSLFLIVVGIWLSPAVLNLAHLWLLIATRSDNDREYLLGHSLVAKVVGSDYGDTPLRWWVGGAMVTLLCGTIMVVLFDYGIYTVSLSVVLTALSVIGVIAALVASPWVARFVFDMIKSLKFNVKTGDAERIDELERKIAALSEKGQ